MMQCYPLTAEDSEIFRRFPAAKDYAYSDRDARIMASVSVRRERIWRMFGLRLNVADLCAHASHELATLEAINGEAL